MCGHPYFTVVGLLNIEIMLYNLLCANILKSLLIKWGCSIWHHRKLRKNIFINPKQKNVAFCFPNWHDCIILESPCFWLACCFRESNKSCSLLSRSQIQHPYFFLNFAIFLISEVLIRNPIELTQKPGWMLQIVKKLWNKLHLKEIHYNYLPLQLACSHEK